MLLTHRRAALLHLCLAVLQASWLTPFVLLLYPQPLGPSQALGGLAAALVIWMLALELLSRRLDSPAFDAVSLALMALTSLLAVRLLLYGGGPPLSLRWLGPAVRDALNFRAGLPPALVIVGANLLLWQRATAATSRDLTFFGVGVTFRGGMLLLFLGGGIYAAVRGVELLALLWVYFAVGLLAVSLARISEKALDAQSAGAILPARRLAQVVVAVAATLGLALVASLAYSPAGLRRFLALFNPLWELLRPLLLALLLLLGRVMDPFLIWLEGVVLRLLRSPAATEDIAPAAAAGNAPAAPGGLPAWPLQLASDILILVLIIGAALGLIVFLLLYLERVRGGRGRAEGEEEGQERGTFGRGILGRGFNALRDAVRLTRRFGLSRQLLAAISVQNIYANLTRIAGRHGRGRLPAQPPDAYLPVLATVFPGHDAALERITAAYMRVHYGDQPVSSAELAALRADYRAVQAAAADL